MNNAITSAISGLADSQPPDPSAPASAMPNLSTPGTAPQMATAPAQQPAPQTSATPVQPNPNAPHAGLRNIMQSLFAGMDDFATSAATGGREGGVEEIQKLNAARQEMALKQQANQRENADFETRQKLNNANLLMATAQYHHNLQMYPLQERETALKLNNDATAAYNDALSAGYDLQDPGQANAWSKLQSRVIKVAFGANQDPGEVMAGVKGAAEQKGGSLVDYVPMVHYNDAKHGTGGEITLIPADGLQAANATPRQIATGLADAKSTLMQATAAYGADNPDVKNFTGRIQAIDTALKTGGNISAYQMQQLRMLSTGPMSTMIAGKEKATKIQQEQAAAKDAAQKADPLFKLENDPSEMTGDKAPAAVAMLQTKLQDPNLAPDQVPRVQRLLMQAQKGQQLALAFDAAKQKAAEAAKDGNPADAADLLGTGLVAPSQLLSTRKPAFVAAALKAAAAKYPGWSAQKSEAQYKYATNPSTQNTLNMVDAIQAPGGVADILLQKGKGLKNTGVPVFNSWAQAVDYAKGGTGVPAYMPAAVDFADMYSKIMGGGQATDSGRLEALNLISKAQTPEQREAAVRTLQETMLARKNQMVRDNPALKAMYPDTPKAAPAPAGATMKVPGSDGKMHWSDGKQDLGVVQ